MYEEPSAGMDKNYTNFNNFLLLSSSSSSSLVVVLVLQLILLNTFYLLYLIRNCHVKATGLPLGGKLS